MRKCSQSGTLNHRKGGDPCGIITKRYPEKLPELRANEELGLAAQALVKFFTPDSNWSGMRLNSMAMTYSWICNWLRARIWLLQSQRTGVGSWSPRAAD